MLTLIRRFISEQSFAVRIIAALATAAVAYTAVASTGGRPIDGALAAAAALGFHGTAGAVSNPQPILNVPSVQFTAPEPESVHASSVEATANVVAAPAAQAAA